MIIDTHTHADHRSDAIELGELTGAPVVMHRRSPTRFRPLPEPERSEGSPPQFERMARYCPN